MYTLHSSREVDLNECICVTCCVPQRMEGQSATAKHNVQRAHSSITFPLLLYLYRQAAFDRTRFDIARGSGELGVSEHILFAGHGHGDRIWKPGM